MNRMTFNIPEENLSKLHAVIERINKRAKKLEMETIQVVRGNGSFKTFKVKDDAGNWSDITTMVYPVEVIGQQPILSGWKFLGKLDHLPGGNVVLGSVPEQYYNCPPNCDHCNKDRDRSETIVLENLASG